MHGSHGRTSQPQWGGGGEVSTGLLGPPDLVVGFEADAVSGIHRSNGVRSSTSLMYQTFFWLSQRAPSALTLSFSAKGVVRLMRMLGLSIWIATTRQLAG